MEKEDWAGIIARINKAVNDIQTGDDASESWKNWLLGYLEGILESIKETK